MTNHDSRTANHDGLAIVGIGCLFPKAAGLAEYWSNIKAKVDGIGPVPPTHWNPNDYFDADPKRPDMTYARRGGFLDPVAFPPGEFGIAPNDLEAIDTSQLLALVVAKMAMEDAGLGSRVSGLEKPETRYPRPETRASVILGVTGTLELVVPLGARLGHPLWRKALRDCGVADEVADQVVERISRGYVGWQENSFPGLLGNVVAGRVANRLDLNGTNCVVDAACASSLSAIHLAALELQSGRCDVAVTGGVDTFNDIFMYMCFSKTPALSPTGDAKPFATDADGTILGEGLGIVVLKRLADAERDGNRIYAVIKGMGTSSDGKGNAIYAPSSAGQVDCLRDAYRAAGVTPDTIELIEAHGTGTKVGDAAEVAGLTEVFRDASMKRSWCALGSVKSQLGHTKAAAGAAGLIKAALALYHKVLPPTIKVANPLVEPGATPFYVNTECRPWLPRDAHPRRAGVSAFGFGGSNFHCVLEEHDRRKPEIDWPTDITIFALCDSSIRGLQSRLPTATDWPSLCAGAADSRRTFDPAAAHRLLVVVQRSQLPDFDAIRTWLADPSQPTREGCYYGEGSVPGGLGFLFPGQGAQSVGMLRDLACTFPVMQDVLAEADRAFAAGLADPAETRLSDFIYPQPAFTPEARTAHEEALRSTPIAQPALGAVSLGAMQVLAHFGVKPQATAGHSYGELTALCAAGCFEAPSLFELSQLRGRLMANPSSDDAGGMLAVQAPLEAVESLIRSDQLDLVIANKNSPTQAVLSGRVSEIDRAAKALQSQRIANIRLPVAAAFHSASVAGATKPFRAALEPIVFHTAQLPVYANTTGRVFPRDPQAIRDLLAEQIAKPVEFVEQIRNMADAGLTTFLEVGPGRTLTRLVGSILGDRPHTAIALDSSAGKRTGLHDLAHALAQLAAIGYPVDLARWDPDAPPAPTAKPALTIPICGANYRKPQPELPPPKFPPPQLSRRPHLEPKLTPTMAKNSTGDSSNLQRALAVSQESLAAFQKLQEQTAQLHKQFLESQEVAQRTLQTLVEGQQRIVSASLGISVSAPPIPAPAQSVVSPAIDPQRIGRERAPTSTPSPIIERPQIQPDEPGRLAVGSPAGETNGKLTAPTVDRGHIERTLIAIIAEKTGYPPDMLGLDMGLDADLGIDSIKRVEILSALQDKLPEAPIVKPEHLGTLHTLREIVEFLSEGEARISGSGDRVSGFSAPETRHPRPDTRPSGDKDHVEQTLIAIIAEKTGYPPDMLGLDMGLDADLGIDSIKRVEILSALQDKLPEAPIVKPEHLGTLHTLREIVEFLCGGEAPSASQPLATETKPVASSQGLDRQVIRATELATDSRSVRSVPAGSLVWIVADSSPLANELSEHLRQRKLKLHVFSWDAPLPAAPASLSGLALIAGDRADVARKSLPWLQLVGPALKQSHGFLTTVTHLDGLFGFSGAGPQCKATVGALAGLAKTASHEWQGVACKAIDLSSDAPVHALADELFREGPLEVGITGAGRHSLELVSAPLPAIAAIPLGSSDVVVITGGARGVTAEVAVELARSGATLVLLGRSPDPSAESAELAACADEVAIKRLLSAQNGRSLREIDAESKTILAAREIRGTLERITAAGGKVLYRSVDIRDVAAVRAALDGIGAITGVIHGAGVLADRRLEDLTVEQFDSVYETKVGGLQNLLASIGEQPLKFLVLFSSSTGRFGRTGQAAYAAANEALNKIAQFESRRRPQCRVVALNWGPWAGGMVTPALANLFAAERIELISLADGAKHVLAELAAADRATEVVVLGGGSHLLERASEKPDLHFVFEREIDLERAPVLRAHVIDGRAVLPLALTLEWFAHAALHGQPGLVFQGCDRLRVFHPVLVRENQFTTVQVFANSPLMENGNQRIAVELRGRRPNGQAITHSRGEIAVGGSVASSPPARRVNLNLPAFSLDPDDVYQRILFHGPELRGIEQIVGCGPDGISVLAQSAPAPALWLDQPLRGQWITDPLVIDCAFQAMSLWCHSERGAVSLPSAVGRYRQYRRFVGGGPTAVDCRVVRAQGQVIVADIEFVDPSGVVIATIEGFECVLDPSLNQAFRRNRLEPAGT